MNEILDAVNSVHRTVGRKTIPAGDGRTVLLRRTYGADVKDVWDAITSAERLARWFLPVTGELRLGGSYQLEGNARGEILECEPPHRLKVSWVYGENTTERDISEVEVRLEPAGEDATTLVLEHAAVVPEEFWGPYGPGATGVGWDLGLLGLGWHLDGREIDRSWDTSAEGKQFATRSAQAWGEASLAAGEPADVVQRQVAGTTEFYTQSG